MPKKKKKRKLTAWQKHVKATMKKFPGLSFKEALPKAKLTYKGGSKPRSKSRPKKAKTTKTKKVKRKMGRRRRRKTRAKRKFTLPVAIVAPVGLTVGNALLATVPHKDPATKAYAFFERLTWLFTGWSNNLKKWEGKGIASGLLPILIGGMIHKFVGGKPLNVNRMLGRAQVPIVRV